MNERGSAFRPLTWPRALLLIVGAAGCFELAYLPIDFGPLRFFVAGYLICLVQLARLNTTRNSFYAGLAVGFLCAILQLDCFRRIFGIAAVPLWVVLAFWIGSFVALLHAVLTRFGARTAMLLAPFLWTGLEYFRSELYYLKFSWLNAGYPFATWQWFPFPTLGMYGVGFVLALCAALFLAVRWYYAAGAGVLLIVVAGALGPTGPALPRPRTLHVAGVQLEFPMELQIPQALNRLLARHPDAQLIVLSEYTLQDPPPESLKAWCRTNHRYLIVGGKDPAPNGNFYDTAFVIDPAGEIVFRQVKSVPIQFFKDGLPAPQQALWESPWGKVGICICYDLSYTRVTDRLVKLGAQLLIVPTMDVVDWGRRQHELHALVAPVRAAEYGLPIFRVASSGISQAVDERGRVIAQAPFPGEENFLAAELSLPAKGSLPIDRLFAPASAGVTLLLVIALTIRMLRRNRNRSATAAISSEVTPPSPSESPAAATGKE